MSIDLSNLKVGDTVHFSDGGSAIVPSNLKRVAGMADGKICVVFLGKAWDARTGKALHPELFGTLDILHTTKPEPKRIRGWVNVYEDGSMDGKLYNNSLEAFVSAKAYESRTACVYIDVAEGEGIDNGK